MPACRHRAWRCPCRSTAPARGLPPIHPSGCHVGTFAVIPHPYLPCPSSSTLMCTMAGCVCKMAVDVLGCPLTGVVQQVADQFQHVFAVAETGDLWGNVERDAARRFVVNPRQHIHQHRQFHTRVKTLGGIAKPRHPGAFQFAFGELANAFGLQLCLLVAGASGSWSRYCTSRLSGALSAWARLPRELRERSSRSCIRLSRWLNSLMIG